MGKNAIRAAAILLSVLFFNGCTVSQKQEEPYNRNEAQQRIRDRFKDDLGINTVVTSVENTLFIYIPSQKTVIKLDKAMSFGAPKKSTEAKLSFIHVDSMFEDNIFNITYATAELPESKQFIKNITYNYSLQTQEIMNKMYNLIYESMSDREDHYEFFVVILADIKKGLKIKLTFSNSDLRKSIIGVLPFFEFNKRVISEIDGSSDIVNDIKGENVDYSPILVPNFASDLVIQYLRGGSDITPSLTAEEIVLKRFYKICNMYDYTQFLYVKAFDQINKTEALVSYDELHERFGDQAQ